MRDGSICDPSASVIRSGSDFICPFRNFLFNDVFGFIERQHGEWVFKAFWAHDQAEEAQATEDLVAYLTERRRRFPNMHVYHYNHTERSSLQRLAADYAVAELELEQLIASGLFVDLYPIVTGAMQAGVESYGLKHIEQLTTYKRSHDIDRGAGAVVEYEQWMNDRDQARLDRIARYNEDDVRATLAVRDWLPTEMSPLAKPILSIFPVNTPLLAIGDLPSTLSIP